MSYTKNDRRFARSIGVDLDDDALAAEVRGLRQAIKSCEAANRYHKRESMRWACLFYAMAITALGSALVAAWAVWG